jgi:pyruvate/2-oxoglutarate dehydrogenase complex dihydrolipoamide dehydrogenase (E3) component
MSKGSPDATHALEESWRQILEPPSEANQLLAERVRPADWAPPRPKDRYNLVVIGGGTAGLVAAVGSASLGARVALVEQGLLGGDCLNVGCVPSKALLRAARAAAEIRRAVHLGARTEGRVWFDFAAVMERVRRVRAELARHDSAARLRDLGVDVFFASASFTGPDTIAVGSHELRFARALIATGTRPALPPLPGLEGVPYLTNETVFSLTEIPPRLAVLGAGPIGCELGQAFARFGSRVTLIDVSTRVLPRDDPQAAQLVQAALESDGVEMLLGAKAERVERTASGGIALTVQRGSEHRIVEADALLLAVGRTPNVDSLGLEAAQVGYDPRAGVVVDDFLRTTNPRIYAAGDVCSSFRFTHAADAMARIVIQNALFFGRARVSRLLVPWCTYTDPELAQVGVSEEEASARGLDTRVLRVDFAEVDRAVADQASAGFLKIVASARSGRILGATIVGVAAGEIAAHLATLVSQRISLAAIARSVLPYPTLSLAIKRAADQWNRSRLTPRVQRFLRALLAWRR